MGSQQSQQSQQSQPQQQPQQSFSFYSIGTAATLAAAEDLDHYRADCQESRSNRIARDRTTYSYNRMGDQEEGRFLAMIHDFRNRLPDALQPIQAVVVPLMPSADAGMPHTRPHHIIAYPLTGGGLSFETFSHELWHIHQRKWYKDWVQFFEKEWRFRVFEGDLPSQFEFVLRINPDTMTDPLWVWNDTWVPMCVFLNPVTPELSQTDVWFYNVRSKTYVQDIPPAMAEFFSKHSRLPKTAFEHPCELAAYGLTDASLQSEAIKKARTRWVLTH